MSNDKGKHAGFSPASNDSISMASVEKLVDIFLKISDNTTIKWSIYAAGIASVLEIMRIGWLALRYIFRF
jgi:hypothetical protein